MFDLWEGAWFSQEVSDVQNLCEGEVSQGGVGGDEKKFVVIN